MLPSALEMGASQLLSVTKIEAPQPFSCVSRIPILYDFRGSGLVIRYSVNTALSANKCEHFHFSQPRVLNL